MHPVTEFIDYLVEAITQFVSQYVGLFHVNHKVNKRLNNATILTTHYATHGGNDAGVGAEPNYNRESRFKLDKTTKQHLLKPRENKVWKKSTLPRTLFLHPCIFVSHYECEQKKY